MTVEQFRDIADFENTLHIGQRIRINWTNTGSYYTATAIITKINEKSVRATLEHEVAHRCGEPYRVGREIIVPRLMDHRKWSYNNGAFPL